MVSSSPALDAVFLHVPRFRGGRREVMVMPLGVPALANLLADEGRAVEIWHLGLESELAGGFSLRAALLESRPRIVLLSLHWNQQTRPVLDVAQRVSRWLPEARIVLGGLTASVFARDLAALPFVDAVVRGDGERPLSALARAWLDGEGRIEAAPNLVWRDEAGRVVESAESWVLDEAEAAGLRHGDLGLLRHRDEYVARALYADFSEGARGAEGYAAAAYLNAGRGCTRACACCGGAAPSQRVTSRRAGLLCYPLPKLMGDLRDAVRGGARVVRMSFDPPERRDHLLRWLEAIRADSALPGLAVIFDLFDLPDDALLDGLSRTFPAGSTVVLSPECGSEAVRARVRPPGFGNDALLDAVARAEARGLSTHCFFSAGLPTETPADVDETERLVRRLLAETGASVSVTPMMVDPASPISLEPARWGVRLLRRTLADFYDERGLPEGPGYETDHFDEAEILSQCDRLLAVAGLPPTWRERSGLDAAI